MLEDALYCGSKDKIENAGKKLIEEYYAYHENSYKEGKAFLNEKSEISKEEKNKLSKLFPARLLNNYFPPADSLKTEPALPDALLEKAKEDEEHYSCLLQEAREKGYEEKFLKRNKGKQFKLKFIWKAWQKMYFRDAYDSQVKLSGEHHKSYNITRDEYNDFCRYMYAFDEVKQYKEYLHDLLNKKNFFNNESFKHLFGKGNFLDDFYRDTKIEYEKRALLQQDENITNTSDKYKFETYKEILGGKIFYINLSHFLEFLRNISDPQKKELGKMQFKSLENVPYLIPEYYYAERLDASERKTNGKLFNELRKIKLEDSLLYEMALRYLKTDNSIVFGAKNTVSKILSQEISFDIKDYKGNFSYKLKVPFKQIDSLACLLKQKDEQDNGKFHSSFINNIAGYLLRNNTQKGLKEIYENFSGNPKCKILHYDELNKIKDNIITESVKFTEFDMMLEKNYICKPDKNGLVDLTKKIEQKKKTGCRYIDFNHTGVPADFCNSKVRNKAFHFLVPNVNYSKLLQDIEKKFIFREIVPDKPAIFDDLNLFQQSVCRFFLSTLHGPFFNRGEKDDRKKRRDAEQKFFESKIFRR